MPAGCELHHINGQIVLDKQRATDRAALVVILHDRFAADLEHIADRGNMLLHDRVVRVGEIQQSDGDEPAIVVHDRIRSDALDLVGDVSEGEVVVHRDLVTPDR